MDEIKFVNIPTSLPPLELFRGFPCDMTRALLRIAFDHGGYVAGGFAVLLARWLTIKNYSDDELDIKSAIMNHLRNGGSRPLYVNNKSKFRTAGIGDIDVWFPSEASLCTFNADPRLHSMLRKPEVCYRAETFTKIATEYVIEEGERVQIIHGFVMPKVEQLSHFDIYNSMVAFDDKGFTMPEHWETLESKHVLHVVSWQSPWTVKRFYKYMRTKGYKSVTESTAGSVATAVKASLLWCKMNPNPTEEEIKIACCNPLTKAAALRPGYISHLIKDVVPSMTNETLLEVSSMLARYVEAGYGSCGDSAMNELVKRSGYKLYDK